MSQVFIPEAIEKLESAIGSKKLGGLFLELGYINTAQLDRALEYQRQKGGLLGWILASLGYITRLQLYEGLAKHLSLPLETDMGKALLEINRSLASAMTCEEMLYYQTVPFNSDGKVMTVLTSQPNLPDVKGFLRERFKVSRVIPVIATDTDILKLAGELNCDRLQYISTDGLQRRAAVESASRVFTKEQVAFTAGVVGMLAFLLYYDTASAFLAVLFVAQAFLAVPVLFKFALSLWGKIRGTVLTMKEAGRPYNEHDLPLYSVMVPVYQEKTVISNLIQGIRKLDYPENKLDVFLLFEKDDTESLEAAKAAKLPANWRFIVCPERSPKTKTGALSYGLSFIRGEYVAVYDAEDLPDPDQLKKAVTAFRTHTGDYIGFRAEPAYFNQDENWLTRASALEQSAWTGGLEPGLMRAGVPLPLGKTGTHFNVAKLRKLGAWDPFNVNEETDLGIRAAAAGCKVGVIDSSTYREATPRLMNWIKQRSRWVKGCLQTSLVHLRHPMTDIRAAGFFKWLGYTLFTGNQAAVPLLYPVVGLLLILSICFDVFGILWVPSSIIYLMALNILGVNLLAVFTAILGIERRQQILPAMMTPVYLTLQSIAAYRGFFQLFTRPFYWEKTEHGLTADIPVSRTHEIPGDVPEMVVVREKK